MAASRLEGRRLCDRENRETQAAPVQNTREGDGLFLFTTQTCPNCTIAKRELDKAGLAYQVCDVAQYRDLAARYGVQQAPTLVVRHGDQVEKLVNASVIKHYAATHE